MLENTIISCYITKKVKFNFHTVGIRKNYYKDGSHALLKEKKLSSK